MVWILIGSSSKVKHSWVPCLRGATRFRFRCPSRRFCMFLVVLCWWMQLPASLFNKNKQVVFPWGLDRLCMNNLCYSWCWSWNTYTNLGHLLLIHGNNVLLLCCKGFVWYSFTLRWKGSARCMCSRIQAVCFSTTVSRLSFNRMNFRFPVPQIHDTAEFPQWKTGSQMLPPFNHYYLEETTICPRGSWKHLIHFEGTMTP